MTTSVSDTPSAPGDAEFEEPNGTKVAIKCSSCGALMAKASVHPGLVSIGPRSPVDHDGFKEVPDGGFQLECCGGPFVMERFDLAKLAEARAGQPKDGWGRSIRIGPQSAIHP